MCATLAVLEALGENAEGQDLYLCHGFISSDTVGKYSRQLRHFRQPTPILFALTLDIEVHGQLPGSDSRILRLAPIRCLTPKLSGAPTKRAQNTKPRAGVSAPAQC